MSITITERYAKRELSEDRSTARHSREYTVIGTDDELVAYELIKAAAPVRYSNLWRNQIRVQERADGLWDGEISYSPLRRESGQSEWSFNIGTKQIHVSHSLETVSQNVPDGEDAADFKQAINVTGDAADMRVEGVDIPSPTLTWQETLYLDLDSFTSTYLSTLFNAVGKVNSGDFRIWSEQEVQLLGVSGEPAGDVVKLTFQFTSEPSKTGLTIGDIEGIAKKGFEYLWVRWETSEDDTAKVLTQKAKQVNVEKVIDTVDFDTLGIPDPF